MVRIFKVASFLINFEIQKKNLIKINLDLIISIQENISFDIICNKFW